MTAGGLAEAYAAAIYTLSTPEGPRRLVVGRKDAMLDALLRAAGVGTAARLTAANPASASELPVARNAAANRRLAADLADRGWRLVDCASAAPDGAWPEPGFLVLGIGRAEAMALGRAYGQAGILWCEIGRPVELVMLG